MVKPMINFLLSDHLKGTWEYSFLNHTCTVKLQGFMRRAQQHLQTAKQKTSTLFYHSTLTLWFCITFSKPIKPYKGEAKEFLVFFFSSSESLAKENQNSVTELLPDINMKKGDIFKLPLTCSL